MISLQGSGPGRGQRSHTPHTHTNPRTPIEGCVEPPRCQLVLEFGDLARAWLGGKRIFLFYISLQPVEKDVMMQIMAAGWWRESASTTITFITDMGQERTPWMRPVCVCVFQTLQGTRSSPATHPPGPSQGVGCVVQHAAAVTAMLPWANASMKEKEKKP